MTDRLASIGANTLAPRATLGPAGNGDALANINTTPLADGASVYVLSSRALFRLNKTSSAVADGVNIIAPIAGPGRWFIEVNAGAGSQIENEAGVLFPFRSVIQTDGVYVSDTGAAINLNQGQFDARNYGSLALAVAAAAGQTLVIADAQVIGADVTDPTVTLKFKAGGVLSAAVNRTLQCALDFSEGGQIQPANGVKVTLSGPVALPETGYAFDVSAGGSFVFVPPAIAVLTPYNFGAKADGSTDDAPGTQAALDTAVASGMLEVHIPRGSYLWNSQITLVHAVGLIVRGAGCQGGVIGDATYIAYHGAGGDVAALRLANCRDCIIRDFDLAVWEGSPTNAIIEIHQDDAGGGISSHNTFEHLQIFDILRQVPVGIWIDYEPTSGNNNEYHSFRDVYVYDPLECGWRIGARSHAAFNAKQITFDTCAVLGDGASTVNGIESWYGSFRADNCSFSDLLGYNFRIAVAGDPCVIDTGQSERTLGMLWIADQSDADQSTGGVVVLDNFRFTTGLANGVPGGNVVLAQYLGPLAVRSTYFYDGGTGYPMGVKIGTVFGTTATVEISDCYFVAQGNLERGNLQTVGPVRDRTLEQSDFQRVKSAAALYRHTSIHLAGIACWLRARSRRRCRCHRKWRDAGMGRSERQR